MKRRIVLLAFAFAAASLGFSQTTSGTTSTSTSTNIVNATVVAAGSATPHQLVQAAPGPIPGMFPGNAMGPGACYIYRPRLKNLKYLTPSSIDSMAKGEKLPHGVKPTPIEKAAKADSYDGPIGVMEYDPTGDAVNDGDIALAGISMPGKPFEINEALLGVAVKALKKVAPAMRRVAVLNCFIFAEVTDTSSKGIGAVASGTNGTGQIGGSGSIGWFHGKSSTEQQRHVVTTVYAMNGPYNLLTPPTPEPKRDDVAIVRPTPQPEPKAPPVLTVRMEVVTMPSAQNMSTPVQPPQPPAPAATAAPMADCNIPQLTIDFYFGRADIAPDKIPIKDKYRDEINSMAGWLKSHPACKVQVQGHASHEASRYFNVKLGQDRWDTVYNLLIAAGAPKGSFLEGASLGKDFPKSEYPQENRRVILVVQGPASGR